MPACCYTAASCASAISVAADCDRRRAYCSKARHQMPPRQAQARPQVTLPQTPASPTHLLHRNVLLALHRHKQLVKAACDACLQALAGLCRRPGLAAAGQRAAAGARQARLLQDEGRGLCSSKVAGEARTLEPAFRGGVGWRTRAPRRRRRRPAAARRPSCAPLKAAGASGGSWTAGRLLLRALRPVGLPKMLPACRCPYLAVIRAPCV